MLKSWPTDILLFSPTDAARNRISGIGADIGANIIARVIDQHLSKISSLKQINWGSITKDVQDNLRLGVNLFTSNNSADLESVVVERFLFTVMIVITTDNLAMIVSFGDGIVIIDDKVISIESPILNSPPYLGYMLLKDSAYHTKKLSSYLAFSVVKTIDLSKLKKGLIVGTDGLKDLMHEDLHHPSLVQPKTLQRWLNALTSEKIHNGSFITGKCSDDVSMVIIRTDKAQDRLLKSRREVAELKREIARLQSELTTAVESLKKPRRAVKKQKKNWQTSGKFKLEPLCLIVIQFILQLNRSQKDFGFQGKKGVINEKKKIKQRRKQSTKKNLRYLELERVINKFINSKNWDGAARPLSTR